MEYTIRKKNTPISTLIKNYLDKKISSRRFGEAKGISCG